MLDLRTEYCARFGAFPGVVQCEPHDGEFDADEIARLGAQRTPAIFVACVGVGDVLDESGPAAAELAWTAMIVARGPDAVREGQDSAGDIAALLAIRITAELRDPAAAPFAAALTMPSKVRAANLFGSAAARKGWRLWAVTWTQATSIRPDELDAVLDDYLLQHTAYPGLPDETGAPSAIDTRYPPP